MARKLSGYQLHMKRALKGKMKGKTKAQRKAIFKAAARSWKKKGKSTRTRSSSRKTSKSASKSSPSRRSRMRSWLNFNRIKSWVQKIALIAPAVGTALEPVPPIEKINRGLQRYTGFRFDGGVTWRWDKLIEGWGPYIAAVTVTEGISLLKRIIKGLR